MHKLEITFENILIVVSVTLITFFLNNTYNSITLLGVI
jgi:hypothetical protein